MLGKTVNFLNLIASWFARGICWVAVAVLFVMMALTGIDVGGRYIFKHPMPGSMELTEVFMAMVVGLSLAYCALEKGHVRVDVILSRLPPRTQIYLDFVAHFVFLGLFVIMTWRTLLRSLTMIKQDLITQVLFIPVPPFAFIVTIGFAVLCIVLLRDLFDDVYRLVKK